MGDVRTSASLAVTPLGVEHTIQKMIFEVGLAESSIAEVSMDIDYNDYFPRLLWGTFVPMGDSYKLVVTSKTVNEVKGLMTIPKTEFI